MIKRFQHRYQRFTPLIPYLLILYAIYLIFAAILFILSGAPLIVENVPDNYNVIPPVLVLGATALFPLILLLGLLLLSEHYDSFFKLLGFGLIVYLGYILVVFFLFLSSESYIVLSQSSSETIYMSPLLFYLPAVFLPIFIPLLAFEFRFRYSQATPGDKTTILYLTLYLLLQVGFSVLLFLCYTVIFRYPISDLTNIAEDFSFPSWLVGSLFSIFQISLSFFLVWKWVKSNLPPPSLFHWSVAYGAYIFLYSGLVALFALFDPSMWEVIISAPNILAYILAFAVVFVLLPSFSYILTSYKVSAQLLILLFPDVMGDSAFMLVFLFLGGFLIALIFVFPFVPLFLFYVEVSLIKRFSSTEPREFYKIRT
ncbi:MAG: hypothetical protein ACW98G_05335 [Candidatus Hodarchaeales archaeon]